jgi:hypothetical protein
MGKCVPKWVLFGPAAEHFANELGGQLNGKNAYAKCRWPQEQIQLKIVNEMGNAKKHLGSKFECVFGQDLKFEIYRK